MRMLKIMIATSLILVFSITLAFQSDALSQSQSKVLRGPETTVPILIAQSDRGCCVLQTSRVKCAYTSRQYCEAQAQSAGVKFKFHKGKSCREIESCPAR